MDNWDEIRTAWAVARHGTVSGAADSLGVHHATVIRHIDALEGRLGTRLFQRHARGYAPTEAGQALFEVAQGASDRFNQLEARIKGEAEEVTGELVVTAIPGLTDLLVPIMAQFRTEHPQVRVRFLSDMRLYRLNSGEAHVAVRAGPQPSEPDYVVRPLTRLRYALYAAPDYVARHGAPAGDADLARHEFVAPDDLLARAPFHQWLQGKVSPDRLVFRASEPEAVNAAIRAGVGIGFQPCLLAAGRGLVEVMAPRPEWEAPLWLVTHVDLHRSAKVQALTAHLKAALAGRG